MPTSRPDLSVPLAPAGGATSRPATAGPEAPGAEPLVESGVTADGAGTTTIRLPFVTATFTRAPRPARPVTSSPTAGVSGGTVSAQAAVGPVSVAAGLGSVRGVPLSRLAFYGGAVALGALELVEWPVTLLVVAGTYVADRARASAGAGSAAGSPAGEPPALVVPSPAEQHTAGAGAGV